MNSIATLPAAITSSALTAPEMRARVQRIQEVMKSVMKEGVHFGKIPGTPKETLYKPGSEVLLTTFQIAVVPEVEDLSYGGEIRYRAHVKGIHQPEHGTVIGVGLGECSSLEEKYRWRRATGPKEFEAADPERKRIKYGLDREQRPWQEYTVEQVRIEPADVANTILKMAKKRGQIDLCLTGLAASDVFAQDLEDMDEQTREAVTEGAERRKGRKPTKRRQATKLVSDRPGGHHHGRSAAGRQAAGERRATAAGESAGLDSTGIPENELLAAFELGKLEEIPSSR